MCGHQVSSAHKCQKKALEPRGSNHRLLRVAMWMLEPRPSAKATGSLNHWAISPSNCLSIIKKKEERVFCETSTVVTTLSTITQTCVTHIWTKLLEFIFETRTYYRVETNFELIKSSYLSFSRAGMQVYDIISNNTIKLWEVIGNLAEKKKSIQQKALSMAHA